MLVEHFCMLRRGFGLADKASNEASFPQVLTSHCSRIVMDACSLYITQLNDKEESRLLTPYLHFSFRRIVIFAVLGYSHLLIASTTC